MLSARSVGLPIETDRGISTKTPGRVLTKTRNVLQENAVHNGSMTVIAKGRNLKVVQNTPLPAKTSQTDRALKDPIGKQIGPSKLKDVPATRPLGDKTPFPNRTFNQQHAGGTKITKPALQDGSLRPSSARKHDRLPRSANKAFETPITNGKHWDVSDIDIQADVPATNQSTEEESYDEIEYMPPKVEDIPYDPPFEMPNYREVGKTLMALIRSHTLEDDPPSIDLTFIADPSENNFFAPPTFPQPEIEDDSPFARPKPEPEVKPQSSTIAKGRSTAIAKTTPRSAAPRITQGTHATTPANSRAISTVRRPATATSTCPPTTVTRILSSQPVIRPSTSQSTLRPSVSRAVTRTPSVTRPIPPVRASSVQASLITSQPTPKSAARSTVPTKGRANTSRPSAIPTPRNPAPTSNALPNIGRPRSGTITKEEFESNTHVAVHIRNSSLEDVKKDLEGLIVFEDAFDEDDEFQFNV